MTPPTPAEQAYAALAEMETLNYRYYAMFSWTKGRVKEIRRLFAAGKVVVNKDLEARLRSAFQRVNRLRGEDGLKKLEALTDGAPIRMIENLVGNIYYYLGSAGVTIDENLKKVINNAADKCHKASVKKGLDGLEVICSETYPDMQKYWVDPYALDYWFDAHGIDYWVKDIRSHFDAIIGPIDEGLARRMEGIKDLSDKLNNVSAERLFDILQNSTFEYEPRTIKGCGRRIRDHWGAAGVIIDKDREKRIQDAMDYRNTFSAEKLLAKLEALDPEYNHLRMTKFAVDEIRKRFIAGGKELTAHGELPDGLQARLNAVVASALKRAEHSKA